MKYNFLTSINKKLGNMLFKLAYLLLMIFIIFKYVPIFNSIMYPIKIISYLLFFINSLLNINKYDHKSIIRSILIATIIILDKKLSGQTYLLFLFICILSSYNISLKDFIKYDLVLKIVLVSILTILSYTGNVSEYIMVYGKYGFSNINLFASYILSIGLEIIYLYYYKCKYLFLLLIPIFSYVLYIITDARTILYLGAIFYVIYILLISKISKKIFSSKIYKILLISFFPLLFFLSIYSVHLYNNNNSYAITLNSKFSNRLKHASKGLNEYEIKPFGSHLTYVYNTNKEQKRFVIDNAYIHLLLSYGYVSIILFGYLIIKVLIYLFKNNDYFLSVILLIYLIYGLTETYMFRIPMNPFLLSIGYVIFNKEE